MLVSGTATDLHREGSGVKNTAESHLELQPNGSRLHMPLAISTPTVPKPVSITYGAHRVEAAGNVLVPISVVVDASLPLCHIYSSFSVKT